MNELAALTPPHDMHAEAAVLSASMIEPAAMDRTAMLLKPAQFYSESHRRIFEACVALHAASKPVDVVQVATWLRDNERLAQVGGFAYLTELLNAAPAVTNVDAYALTVAHKYQLRQTILVCQRILSQAYAGVDDVPAFVDEAERAVYEVARSSSERPSLEPIKNSVVTEFKRWAALYEKARLDPDASSITGVPTGLDVLDEILAGLHEGELTVVAGRPGSGKTSLAVDIAWHVAAIKDRDGDRPYGSAMFSLEMPKEQIADRTICSGAGIDLRKARNGSFDPSDWSKLTASANDLAQLEQFLINDTSSLTLTAVRGMVREASASMRRQGKCLKVVVVDYLQLMRAEGRFDTREQAVGSISRGLKELAKEMKVAVIALAQLNRGVEARADKRPNIADVRESGSIEMDADNVILVYRDEYYNAETTQKGIAELIVGKQRNGPTGTVFVGFKAAFTKFYNLPPDYGQ